MNAHTLLDIDGGSPGQSRAALPLIRPALRSVRQTSDEGQTIEGLKPVQPANSLSLAALAVGVLGLLDGANLLIDRTGAVVWCNSQAQSLLDDGGMIRMTPEQTLTFSGHADNLAFRSLADELFYDRAGSVPEHRLFSLAAPCPDCAVGVVAVMPVTVANGSAVAPAALLVSIRCNATGLAAPAGELRRIYGLTRTEASVAGDLAQGATVEEVAARRGRSIATIRNQQHSAYGKLGVNTQVNLVTLFARHWPRLAP